MKPGHQQDRVAAATPSGRRGRVAVAARSAREASGVAPGLGDDAALAQHLVDRRPPEPGGQQEGAERRALQLVVHATPFPASRLRGGNPAAWDIHACLLTAGMDQSIHDSTSSTVAVSEELFAPVGDDIELCYQTFGDPDDDPLLLVMGLGGPMNWWDAELCVMLAERGFYVVRYDNRDTGRSSRGKGRVTRAMLVSAFAGRRVKVPYSLTAMADDAFGLMDHLGLESAHVAGVSMGGMIAQTMAIGQPARVRSLTSIMSTTGRRTVGWQHPSLLPEPAGQARRPRGLHRLHAWSSGTGSARPATRRPRSGCGPAPPRPGTAGISGSGVLRQMLAVITQPNRGTAPARAADPDPGRARPRGQDGPRLRRTGHGRRRPGRRAAAHRRHGPRPAARRSSRRSRARSAGRRTALAETVSR